MQSNPYAAARIARYYDRNTSRFLRLGRSGQAAAIHRALWAPGVKSRSEAFLYTNQRVAAALLSHHPSRAALLDLGCGVGGTATWLAQNHRAQVTGITISPVQAQIANTRAAELGLGGACRFWQGDFQALPAGLGVFSGAYAIEAFAHSSEPEQFFAQAAAHLLPGGRLFLADDFLAEGVEREGAPAPWVRRVRDDWHLANLQPVIAAQSGAKRAGLHLVSDQNLSAYIHTWPSPWLAMAQGLVHLPVRSPAWENLSGGVALQYCYRRGWTEYHALVFELRG